jgi:hypothetical protein
LEANAGHQEEQLPQEPAGLVGVISAVGGVLVVTLGLAFVFIIALVSLGTVPDDQKATVVTAAFGVLGTVVGTYFGVRAGAAGKERAEAARDFESIKVQELAARMDHTQARAALDHAQERAVEERRASSTSYPAL